jgi:DNA-binding GntR family transcriptional regulator
VRCDSHSHHALIDALSKGAEDDAEALMRSHLVDIHSALDFGQAEAPKPDLRSMLTG